MFTLGGLFASVNARNLVSARTTRPSGSRPPVVALALVLLFGPAACAGSHARAPRSDFEVNALGGIASVGIRASLPGMTDSEFEQLVRMGMGRVVEGGVLPGPVAAPLPQCHIVWNVNPSAGRGVSTLIVNIFDGSAPVAYEEEIVSNSAPTATIVGAIESVTSRLLAPCTDAEGNATSDWCRPRSDGN